MLKPLLSKMRKIIEAKTHFVHQNSTHSKFKKKQVGTKPCNANKYRAFQWANKTLSALQIYQTIKKMTSYLLGAGTQFRLFYHGQPSDCAVSRHSIYFRIQNTRAVYLRWKSTQPPVHKASAVWQSSSQRLMMHAALAQSGVFLHQHHCQGFLHRLPLKLSRHPLRPAAFSIMGIRLSYPAISTSRNPTTSRF